MGKSGEAGLRRSTMQAIQSRDYGKVRTKILGERIGRFI